MPVKAGTVICRIAMLILAAAELQIQQDGGEHNRKMNISFFLKKLTKYLPIKIIISIFRTKINRKGGMNSKYFYKIISYMIFILFEKGNNPVQCITVYEIHGGRLNVAVAAHDSRPIGTGMAKSLYRLVARNGIQRCSR